MRAAEMLLEMSVKRKKAEQIFSGIEPEFNLHVLKLMAFDVDQNIRNHWKTELRTWATRLAILSLKDDNRPVPVKDVFNWLYDEPFGGRELLNVEALLGLLSQQYTRNVETSTNISIKLKSFHQKFALLINKHDPAYDIINQL